MGFELPVDVDYCDHPKVQALIAKLGKRADVFPLRLWFWCAKFAKSGVIPGGTPVIENACRWDGRPGQLHAALIEVGLLEQDGITIHDWMDHAGRKVVAYENKKCKQRRAYSQNSSNINAQTTEAECRNSANQNDDSVGNSSNHPFINETKRNETQTETKRNETKPPPVEVLVSDLAQKAALLSGKGTKPSAVSDWYATISDLISNGISIAQLADDIEKTKGINGKSKTEPPWDFKKRILGAAGLEGRKKTNDNAHRFKE